MASVFAGLNEDITRIFVEQDDDHVLLVLQFAGGDFVHVYRDGLEDVEQLARGIVEAAATFRSGGGT